MKLLQSTACLISAATLAACGGGSGGSSESNLAPEVASIVIRYDTSKTLYTGTTLEGRYGYSDTEQDAEGDSRFRWLVDGEVKGTEQNYTIERADAGKDIVFEVTPVAVSGTLSGAAKQSGAVQAALRDYVPFTAMISENERVTLITDGTEQGTVMVKDFNSATAKENIRESVRLGDQWVVTLDSSTHANQLAVLDGTEQGSVLLGDGAFVDLQPSSLVTFNNKVFFAGSDNNNDRELWSTDGTSGGTQLFMNLSPGNLTSDTPNKGIPGNFAVIDDNTMIFTAYGTSTGTEPWVTNGRDGTIMIRDLNGTSQGSQTRNYFSALGKGFFTYGSDLWVSTGASFQTHSLGSPAPQNVVRHAELNGKVLLVADDDNSTTCAGLWVSDGTSQGSQYIDSRTDGDCIQDITATDDAVYYTTSTVLYRYTEADGVTIMNGTEYSIGELTALGNQLLFKANDGNGFGLYTVNGNEITLVKQVTTLTTFDAMSDLTVLNDEIIFQADDGIHGGELWHSDGTDGGTQLLKDILPGSESSEISLCHLSICIR